MTEVPTPPDAVPPSEPVSSGRKFRDIQEDLYNLKNAPDPAKERSLVIERARLLREARDVGVFRSMKGQMLDIQTNNPSLVDSYRKIGAINPTRAEDEARGLAGWDDKFEGLLEAYKDGAIRNMNRALLIKTNQDPTVIADLERDIQLLNWGTPPAIVDSMPLEKSTTEQGFGFSARDLAKEIAAAQGLQTPEKYLEDALATEEYLKTAFQIVPGAEPRFWPLLTEDEKLEWQVRATLIIAAYKKQYADSTEKLYMGERREMAVDLGKWAHQRIFKKPGVLATVGIYSTAIGDPVSLSYNSPDGRSMKKVFCDILTSRELREKLAKDYGETVFTGLVDEEKSLYKECADSFYKHDDTYKRDGNVETWGTPIDEASFRATRRSVRFWLITKGRDLLLSEQELANRDAFFNLETTDASGKKLFNSKKELYEEMTLRARNAEQIAWNYVYIHDLIETFDSREYRPEGTKRSSPSSWWQLFQWVPMHPQERFEDKIKRGNRVDTISPKEHWSALGTWGVRNITNKTFINGNGEFEMPARLRVLPDTLIRSPLLPQRHLFNPDPRENQKKEESSLFAIYNHIGNDVLFGDIGAIKNSELYNRIDWENMMDSPNVPYVYDEMRWADVVTNVYKKGGERDSKVSAGDLSEAVYNLRLTKQQRELLLVIYLDTVNPNNTDITPTVNSIRWGDRRRIFLGDHPNYFYGVS